MRKILFLSIFLVFSTFSNIWAQNATTSTANLTSSGVPYSPFSVSYFHFATIPRDLADSGNGSAFFYQYISLNYSLSKTEKISLRPAFDTSTPGVDIYGNNIPNLQTVGDDLHVNYSNYDIAQLGFWNFNGDFKLYAPTSDKSKTTKLISRAGAWMRLDNPIGKDWTITYNMKPDYYFRSQTAYLNEYFDNTKGRWSYTVENSQQAKFDHYMTATYKVNADFLLSADLGLVHEWWHSSNEGYKPLNRDSFKLAPNFRYYVSRNYNFIMGVEDRWALKDTYGNNESFVFGRTRDLTYYLLTFVSM